MDKMLAIVFPSEKAAQDGVEALSALSADSSIYVYAAVVVTKTAEGTVSSMRVDGEFPIRTFGGTALGSIIGLLGGPVGAGVGAAAGAVAGVMADVFAAGVDSDFLSDVAAALTPGKSAIVANVSEDWVTPVDTRMEALGGLVFRTLRSTARADHWDREAAALRAQIDQLKAEHAAAHAERKITLQSRIDQLSARREKKLEQSRLHSEQVEQELKAKVDALQQKASREKGAIKAALDARIARLQQDYENRHQR